VLRRYVLVTLAVGVGVTAFFLVTDAGPRRFERPKAPAATGAFRDGGAPPSDPAIERALAVALPRVAHLSFAYLGKDADDGARRHAVAALRAEPAFGQHGEPLHAAWIGLVDGLDHWMTMAQGDRSFRGTTEELRAHADAVSDQLAAAGLGYTIDASSIGDHNRRRADVVGYRVEKVAFVYANSERQRVLELRGLARTEPNNLLGRTEVKAEELAEPVVLLDAIDDKVANLVLPVMGGLAFPIGDDAWSHGPRARAAGAAAADAIRRELAIALGDAADPVGRARELVTASVRHHEAQHGLDADRKLTHPDRLAMLIGGKANDPFALRARLELSAYLSQIASDMWLPQLTLWSLARHGFKGGHVHSEEMFVAAIVVEGLARHLQIAAPGAIFHDGELDRDRLAALVGPIAARSTLELRSAAAAVWTDLFDEKLIRIVDQ